MKEFNLDAALNGEPVMLRNGGKAVVKYNLLNEVEKLEVRDTVYPLIGYRFDGIYINTTSWNLTGKSVHCATLEYDIIGMWEDPKISIEDLPKPFKPEENELYFYINNGCVCRNLFWSGFDENLAKNAQCFKTREDAQKWIDFMKSMME
jgi:hypothetical protein